jgi:hypothetical protein
MREPFISQPRTIFASVDLARRWKRTPDRVRQIAREGHLHPTFVTPGGQRLFDEDEVRRYELAHDMAQVEG